MGVIWAKLVLNVFFIIMNKAFILYHIDSGNYFIIYLLFKIISYQFIIIFELIIIINFNLIFMAMISLLIVVAFIVEAIIVIKSIFKHLMEEDFLDLLVRYLRILL